MIAGAVPLLARDGIRMVDWKRPTARFLAAWLLLQPGLATAALAQGLGEDPLARYTRGEITLHEYESLRRDRLEAKDLDFKLAPAQEILQTDELSPKASDEVVEDLPGGEDGSRIGAIASWIRNIPKRFVRRFAPKKGGYETADEAVDAIENAPVPAYTANAAQREADSNWMRPVKVTARKEADTVQTVIERVIGFGGLAALSKALSGDAQAQKTVQTASKLVQNLSASQKQGLLRHFSNSPISKQISGFIGGKPTSAFGKVIKDGFGNNMILAVLAAGTVSHFLNDGLDLDTLKDRLVALNAIEGRRTWRENMIGQPLEAVAYYHMGKATTAVYERIWNSVASGRGGLAAWVQRTEGVLSRVGQSIVRNPPAALADKAAQLGNTAKSLGLPGISSATALTFKGLVEAGFQAGTIGLIGIPAIQFGWKAIMGLPEGMMVGGNRDKIMARYDLHWTQYQRTGNKLKDALEERRIALLNQMEEYQKFPFTNFLSYFAQIFGGYMGAVVASSVVAPVSIPTFGVALIVSAIFSQGGNALGKWIGAKLDTSKRAYRRLQKKSAKQVFEQALEQGVEDIPERREMIQTLSQIDRLRARLRVRTPKDMARLLSTGSREAQDLKALAATYAQQKEAYLGKVAQVAEARSQDFETLMRVSQVHRNIKYVSDFSDVKILQKGGYTYVQTPTWTGKANLRHDYVDAQGNRAVYDQKRDRLIVVGKISQNNGNRITFVDDQGLDIQGGKIHSAADPESAKGNIVVTKNGLVLENTINPDTKKKEWLVRGYGGEYDIVLRESGRRFSWDGEAFVEVDPTAKALSKKVPSEDDKKFQTGLIQSLTKKQTVNHKAALSEALGDLGRVYQSRQENHGRPDFDAVFKG